MAENANWKKVPPRWPLDCLREHGRILKGKMMHYCVEYDGLPVDETCPQWPCGCKVQQASD